MSKTEENFFEYLNFFEKSNINNRAFFIDKCNTFYSDDFVLKYAYNLDKNFFPFRDDLFSFKDSAFLLNENIKAYISNMSFLHKEFQSNNLLGNFSFSFFENDIIFMLPEIFLSFCILFSICFFVILGNSKKFKFPFLSYSCGLFFFYSFFLTFFLIFNSLNLDTFCFFFHFNNNFFTNLVKLFLIFSSFFCILFSLDYMKKDNLEIFEFFFIFSLSILGMFFLISSFSFVSFYLAIELQSLSLYILASLKKNSNFSTEAGLKYFILGSLASCILLFGISLIYGFSGIIFFDDLAHLNIVLFNFVEYSFFNGLILGLLLLSVGLFFKIGAAPFHVWIPDVYEGVPLLVTAIFAIIPKIVIINFILLFFSSFFSSFFFFWHKWFIFLSFFSFIVGTFGALYQIKIKRLLAYSAISHVGFLCLGLSLNTVEGFQSVFFYILIYVLLSILFFTIIFCLKRYNNNTRIYNILDLQNLFKVNPFFSLIFCLTLFSIAGIPPLMGFFSKFFIFLASIKESFYFISLFSLFLSVVSSFYYIRLIKLIFFEKNSSWIFLTPFSKNFSLILIFLTFLNLFFFLYPVFFLEISYKSSLILFF